MKYLFVCTTELQIVSALNIIDCSDFKDVELDIVLCHRVATKELYQALIKLGVFSKVFMSEAFSNRAPERPYLINWIRSHRVRQAYGVIEVLLYTLKIGRKAHLKRKLQTLSADFVERLGKYHRVYYSGAKNEITKDFINPECEYHAIDEGIGTYLPNWFSGQVDCVHLYAPEIACYGELDKKESYKIYPLKKLSKQRTRLLEWLASLFDVHDNTIDYKGKVVFFDQWYGEKELNPQRREKMTLLRAKLIELVRRETRTIHKEFEVRAHPSSVNRPEEKTVICDKSKKTPFEVNLLFADERAMPDCFVTISSSAAFYWFLMLDMSESKKIIVLHPLFERMLDCYRLPAGLRILFGKIGKLKELQVVNSQEELRGALKCLSK